MEKIKTIPLWKQRKLSLQTGVVKSAKIIGSRLVLFLKIKPDPLSPVYSIKISYRVNKPPKIYILNPKLTLPAGKLKLPHVYKGNKLCLYYPKNNEWHSGLSISNYIIPWISEWIFQYELWLVNGVWSGGGKAH